MHIKEEIEKSEVFLFTLIVLVLSSLLCFIAYKIDDPNVAILSVFTPSLLALVFTAITKGKQGVYDLFVKQTFKKAKIKWFFIALFGIPIMACLAALTSLHFEISKFSLRSTQLMPQVLVITLIAVGEEYGWRGFLLPRMLKKFNLFYSSILVGLIWGIWHFPAYLIGTGVPLQMNFMVFLVWVLLGSLFMSWIYYNTKSVLTSILAHISANAAFNYLFILPEFTGSLNTFFLFMLYLSVALLLVFSVKRNKLLKKYKDN